MASQQSIFVVNADGELTKMRAALPPSENSLQELIQRFPDTISGGNGDLLLIQREHPISDAESGAGRWSLDHLFVTRDAVPVLVEVKRATDTRIRREVVGQMLDYAANAVAYWPNGRVAQIFAQSCEKLGFDPDEQLSRFLGSDADYSAFWSRVDDNFRAGRLKLVFVADQIPAELARIVEFMNEQMIADVYAVELRYFEGDGGLRTLVPRIIGATERANAKRIVTPLYSASSPSEWFETWIAPLGEDYTQALQHLTSLVDELGGEWRIPRKTQGSAGVIVKKGEQERSPLSVQKQGTVCIHFGNAKVWMDDEPRKAFFDRFVSAVGRLSNNRDDGYPSFPLARLLNGETAAAFITVARDWIKAAKDS